MKKVFLKSTANDFKGALDFIKSFGVGYKLLETSNSLAVEGAGLRYIFAKERFYKSHLMLLSMVKKNVRDNLKKVAVGDQREQNLFEINEKHFPGLTGTIKNLNETDLSKAYITSAFLLGLIDKNIYDLLAKQHKRFRLRILGAIASRKFVREFDKDGNLIKSYFEQDDELRNAWFAIVNYTNNVMREVKRTMDYAFVFYWFDNIAGFGDYSNRFKSLGFETKSNLINIKYKRLQSAVAVYVINDTRLFYFPSSILVPKHDAKNLISEFSDIPF
jgi:hypothetical protein